MDALIENGIAIVIAIQSMGAWLEAPMQFFSQLGTEDFFFIVLPLIYWCIDVALGLRIGFILVTSAAVNHTFKLIFAGTRPYWESSHVKAMWSETSFGIPSGHAQNAASIFGIIASYYKKALGWIILGALIFFIGFSRIYLGAHFLHDVIVGWIIGGIIVFFFDRYWGRASTWLSQKNFRQQVLIGFVTSLIFILFGFTASTLRQDFQIPEQWISNALLQAMEVPAPVDPNGIFTPAGTLFGLALGTAWIMQHGGYQPTGPVWKRAVCYVIGLIGILILWMGLGQVFPRGEGFIFYVLRYIRYALVGWWVTGGAPWVFLRLNLAENRKTPI